MADQKFAKTLQKLMGPENYVSDPYDQQSMYEDVAAESSLTPEEIAGIAGVESEFGKYDQPLKGGSARGTFQLMPNTIKYLQERLSAQGSEREPNPLREEARLTGELMKQHEKELGKTLGKDSEISPADVYVKHNLGAGMGKKLLKAKGKTSISDILPEKVIEANPSIYKDKNKAQTLEEIQKRLDKKSKEFKFEDRGPLGFLEE